MQITGIVAEYNPFHMGHAYQIQKIREILGQETGIVCVMSGDFVQRGEPAIFNKWIRAQKAIESGADLVIELPAYYVLQSAEIFAHGAVKILNDLKVVDAISFGSESGDISLIKKVSEIIAEPPKKYRDVLSEKLALGVGYPEASEYALRSCINIDDDKFFSPNNILAMCYVAAAKKI